ncbi:DUF2272 domain-containing protein [Ornithinimicrobium avium]|uniref:DUF2272 domain-containing protein n=1 Tax=Ornithinimicrobium avium TaxID=2283195 RepID=A0A345NKG3_9MICO|nr:DUF2272 domain-containing protein [Ornithinimicrobium avium]AXH95521.1 DUF2272 domain-containing protein [Ornithinimicrobium avium]
MPDVTLLLTTPSGTAGLPRRRVEAAYTRLVPADADAEGAERESARVVDVVTAELTTELGATLVLTDADPEAPAVLHVLTGTGSVRLRRVLEPPLRDRVEVALTKEEVKAVAQPELEADVQDPPVVRRARLVPVGTVPVRFASAELRVAPFAVADWTALGLESLFQLPQPQTTSAEAQPTTLPAVEALPWAPVPLGVDGGFVLGMPRTPGSSWLWWLADGSNVALGAVEDDLGTDRPDLLALPLPPFAVAPTGAEPAGRTPFATSDRELADNPDVYGEDPGAFCHPFSSPERVLGERAFHVILRAEQPAVSSEPTRRFPSFPVLDYDPVVATRDDLDDPRLRRAALDPDLRVPLAGVLGRATSVVRPSLPVDYLDGLLRTDGGRHVVDARHPLDWEGDASRYQAATVARGHILEYRMRWRSNGYSLGTVARSLTLAPRQVRRIQKIEFERLERTRREESTQLVDQVVDQVARDRSYEDSVEASLSEWARGESSSSTSAVAGGFGFAVPGFVAGGGGGHSSAQSASSQSGGRQTRAAEEQRLRDTIRRFADARRKLDSVVVTEVSQEETVTGTVEVVRNANYAHSLTVIYYQILRHLKLETAFAAVRECLFVPFAVKPFTLARAYRWRESLRKNLRDPRYTTALTYLRDVLTGFAGSSVPPGARADQPIRQLRGSMTMRLGVERPNVALDVFDELPWAPLRPFLGSPALSIFGRLRELADHARDSWFQAEQAPRIAAGWVDTLLLTAGGTPLAADFTLASRYQFNGSVRVDFTARPPVGQQLTRRILTDLHVVASRPLTPGSVANVTSFSYTYDTDHFRRSVRVAAGSDDLVSAETGVVDPNGASGSEPPDPWELRDERQEMVRAVQDLLGHLNEHVEFYDSCIVWEMDRNRVFMLVDGAIIPGTAGLSVASVVERDPIAIIGNSLVFRVSAGAFLGLDGLDTPAKLHAWYADNGAHSEPMHVALPTDGLYAQSIMDPCVALEEHQGDLDWVLEDPEPELGSLDPSLLMSRRAEPMTTAPTPLPQTIISLQNAPEAPTPSGLAGALGAVQNGAAFRDMAGLAGTQANAAAGLQTAAGLATSFGQQAAALKMAELAASAQKTKEANQKLATVKKAADTEAVPPEKAQEAAGKILDELTAPSTMPVFGGDGSGLKGLGDLLKTAAFTPGSDVTATPDGLKVALGGGPGVGSAVGALQLASFGSLPAAVGNLVPDSLGGLLGSIPGVGDVVDLFRDWVTKAETFKREVAATARAELAAWAGRPESDPAVLSFLEAYGRAANATDPAVWAAGAAGDTVAWSAGFVSFCVQEAARAAGIPGDPFGRSTLHARYVLAAKQNRVTRNLANPFWLYKLDEVRPDVGDLLCKNRPGTSALTYDNIQGTEASHVDVVTEVSSDHQLLACGGNRTGTGLTVAEAPVALVDGFVTAASAHQAAGPYFAVLRVRTSPLEGITLP